MNEAADILALMTARAGQLEACGWAYSSEDDEVRAELLEGQAKVLRDLVAEVECAMSHAPSDRDQTAGVDTRTAFITEVGGTMRVTVLQDGAWRTAIASFEEEFRTLHEAGHARWELRPVDIPARASQGMSNTGPDVRHAFIEDVRGELNASIHETSRDIDAEADLFGKVHADLIANQAAVWTSHALLIPPRRALS